MTDVKITFIAPIRDTSLKKNLIRFNNLFLDCFKHDNVVAEIIKSKLLKLGIKFSRFIIYVLIGLQLVKHSEYTSVGMTFKLLRLST